MREVVELATRNDRDLVMARLSSPVTGIAPIPFATTAPAVGEELTIAGYGRTRTEWAPTKLHTATFVVDSVSGTTLALDGKTSADATCAGDAGGPIVRQKDGGYELVALGSQSWQGGCWGSDPAETRNNAVSPRVDDLIGGNTLTAGTVLTAGDTLASSAARLTLQADGNLVVVSDAGKTLWSTRTSGHPGATARFTDSGNLTVVDADGTTVLWESGTTAPGGKAVPQNRGDFVIYNAGNESQWAAGTAVRHDYDGDGRSDMADWYGYGDGSDKLHTFLARPDGGFNNPFSSFSRADGRTVGSMKFATGDFDGDGRDDLATLYGHPDGRVKTITWTAKADGTLNSPLHSWETAGGWTFNRIHMIERYDNPS